MVRCVAIAGVCLLAACSTQGVRCDRHLTPINILQAAPDMDAPAQGGADSADKGGTVSDRPQAGKAGQPTISVRSGSERPNHRQQMASAGQGKRP